MPNSRISNQQEYLSWKQREEDIRQQYEKFLVNFCPPAARTRLEKIIVGLIACEVEITAYEREHGIRR